MIASEVLPQEFNAAVYFVDRNIAEGRGARTAFIHENGSLTYRDLAELTNRTGNALRELGVEMEDRVLLLCLDAPEFVGAFWGAIKIGAVPIPVNTLMRAADYLYFLNDSRARVLVVSAPSGYDRFVATLGEPIDKPVMPEPKEIDPAHVAEVCAQFNIQVLGPPPAPIG